MIDFAIIFILFNVFYYFTNIEDTIFVLCFLIFLYFAYFESSVKQGTLGKQVLGIKVIDNTGNRLSFWKASIRHIFKVIFGGYLIIGYLMIIFTEKKQGLHDLVVNSYVVPK